MMIKKYISICLAIVLAVSLNAANACKKITNFRYLDETMEMYDANGEYREIRSFMTVPYPDVVRASFCCDDKFVEKVARMRIASRAARDMQFFYFDQTVAYTNYCRFNFDALYRIMKPDIHYCEDVQSDFLRIIDWLKGFCLEKSPDISRDYLIANPTPLNEEDAYTVRKYLLDEGASLIAGYDDAIELQRTIQALQLINEERDRTRLAELINGGWKTDARILSILNGEQ